MTTEMTMAQFFRELRACQDRVQRRVMQFQLDVATQILREAQNNVKRIFGEKQGAPRSPITLQAMGGSARRQGRGGGLLQSLALERTGAGTLTVTAGGPGVPYAAIHEKGGTIVPKRAKALTIPFAPQYAGRRAREFKLFVVRDEEWGPTLQTKSGQIAYLLRRSVTIPARPYMAPAVTTVTRSEAVRQQMRALFIKDIMVEVG